MLAVYYIIVYVTLVVWLLGQGLPMLNTFNVPLTASKAITLSNPVRVGTICEYPILQGKIPHI